MTLSLGGCMSRDFKILIGFLVTMFWLIAALSNLRAAQSFPASHMVLSKEGCSYFQSLGLKTEQVAGQCSSVVRFRHNVLGSGGVLCLEDDRKISVAETMMLAYSESDIDLPSTPAQANQVWWFWICLGIGILSAIVTLAYWVAGKERR